MKKNIRNDDLIVVKRKVIKCGPTFYISLPSAFIKKHGIKKGEKLPILADSTMMKVVPMRKQ